MRGNAYRNAPSLIAIPDDKAKSVSVPTVVQSCYAIAIFLRSEDGCSLRCFINAHVFCRLSGYLYGQYRRN